MSDLVLLVGALILLALGGELLVRGAVTVAERLGMSPILIGLTLVGFGTSTPELVTSVQAARSGSPGIAVGNVVGSNLSNILLILGLGAVLAPMAIGSRALVRDGAVMLFSAAALLLVGLTSGLVPAVGVAFLGVLATYVVYAYRQETTGGGGGHTAAYEKAEAFEELHDGPIHHAGGSRPRPAPGETRVGSLAGAIVLTLAGLALVLAGGKLLVDSATALARAAGISESVIGLTIVAVGTSMPEFVTTLVAAFRGHGDVAIGNVLGSNIYNVLGIAGLTALLAPTPVPVEIARFDAPLMLVASAALLVLLRTGMRLDRREGAVLLAAYGAYLVALWPA